MQFEEGERDFVVSTAVTAYIFLDMSNINDKSEDPST